MISLGILELPSSSMGLEASGIVTRVGRHVQDLSVGDRVLALSPGAFATSIILPASRCIRAPESLSLEDAATMPLVFSTVIHALCDVGQLKATQVRMSMNLRDPPLTLTIDCLNPCRLWRNRPCGDSNQSNDRSNHIRHCRK